MPDMHDDQQNRTAVGDPHPASKDRASKVIRRQISCVAALGSLSLLRRSLVNLLPAAQFTSAKVNSFQSMVFAHERMNS
jgi:hypothetical protein